MKNISFVLAVLGLGLGPIFYRWSMIIPFSIYRGSGVLDEIKRWPTLEMPIAIGMTLLMGVLPLLLSDGKEHIWFSMFLWILLLLALIDARSMLLPNILTIPMLAFGLGLSAFGENIALEDSLIGAAIGFIFLWCMNAGFRFIKGFDGLGGGDMKLLAAIGAWQGFQTLPLVLLMASFTGMVWGLMRQTHKDEYFPFGPMLCISSMIVTICMQNFTIVRMLALRI